MQYVTGTGGRGRGEDGPISSLPLEIHQDLYNSLEEFLNILSTLTCVLRVTVTCLSLQAFTVTVVHILVTV